MMEKNATELQVNPAQMRTRVSADKLAQLCVSIKEAGMDPTMPVVVFGNEVVSGHRRWLALMLAYFMSEPSIGKAQKVIESRLEVEDGYIQLTPGIYQALAEASQVTVPVIEFQGDEREALLSLLRAGGGAEDPDLLGLSHAFTVALEKGISQKKLARTYGISESKVELLVALGQVDKRLARLIQDGQVPLRVCRHLRSSGPREQGVVEAILDRLDRYSGRPLKADDVVKAAKAVQNFQGFQAGLEDSHADRTRCQAYNVIWQRLLEQDAVAVWAAAADWALWGREVNQVDQGGWLLGLDDEENPWFTRQSRYGYRPEFDLVAMAALLPELHCETCVFQKLPGTRLKADLDLPCRKKKAFEGRGCLAHLAEDQPFSIRVPYQWDVPDHEVTDRQALLAAYEKQKKEETEEISTGEDIQAQRELIRAYMTACDEESDWDVDHPWATWCGKCRWRLDQSPTKDPNVPHCEWARRRRRLRFRLRLPVEEGTGRPIPLCLQYGPLQEDWWEMVPSSRNFLTFPRPVIQRAIEQLDGRVHSYERSCLQFLIGTPLKSKDSFYRFSELLKKQIGDLSDAQLQTVFEWAMCEWMRACKHWQVKGYPIPVGGGYVIYEEVAWDGSSV